MEPEAEPLAKENDIVFGLNKLKRYRVIRLLGEGAFGAVFEVERVDTTNQDQTTKKAIMKEDPKKGSARKKKGEASAESAEESSSNHSQEDTNEANSVFGTVSQLTVGGGTGKAFGLATTSVVGGKYAMKCELLNAKMKQLKMELELLRTLATKNGRHFCDVYDRAKTDKYKFIVMTLAGKSLSELKREYPDNHFSIGTALRVGLQCLEALEDLHEASYLHRDVKPANFASGGVNQTSKILMLDFGLARAYKHLDGKLRRPREKVGFRGTIRYAPLACHRLEDMGRKDDVEGWFYMQVEILSGLLPWRQCGDKLKVQKLKTDARIGDRTLFLQDCPKSFDHILKYIDELKFWSKPDYDYIYKLLRRSLARVGVSDTDPYDWETCGPNKSVMAPPPIPRSDTSSSAGGGPNRHSPTRK